MKFQLNKTKIAAIIIIVSVVALIAGGAYFRAHRYDPNNPAMTERDLKNAAAACWDAKKNKDNKVIYSFADKVFKSKITESQFMQKPTNEIIKYEIIGASVSPETKTGIVKVKFTTTHVGFEFNPTINEQWIFEDGKGWCIDLSASRSPFGNPLKKN